MKKCKIIHINDGHPKTLNNENFLFAEEYVKAEDMINAYLEEGYEVKQIIPEISPSEFETGNITFYRSGFTVYLEKEVSSSK